MGSAMGEAHWRRPSSSEYQEEAEQKEEEEMSITLRDGSTTEDPRLDRLVAFDPRSLNFPVRTIANTSEPRSYTWPCHSFLDQGNEGACVGFSISHEIAAIPAKFNPSAHFAQIIYREAQRVDQWEGEAYSGTSVLAGMKIAKELGFYSEYRWAFNLNDALVAVSRVGPAVLGCNWYERMFTPDSSGYLHPEGEISGGHAIMIRGVNVKDRSVTVHNSWGPDWGKGGLAKMTWAAFGKLLSENGECVIPVQRREG